MKYSRNLGSSRADKWIRDQKRTDLMPIEALRTAYRPLLIEAFEALSEIAGKISAVELFTAIDHNKWRSEWLERALRGEFITPNLHYNEDLLRQVSQNKATLEQKVVPLFTAACKEVAVSPAGQVLAQLAMDRLTDTSMLIQLAQAMLDGDADKASSALRTCYGLPNREIVEYAKAAIEDRKVGRYTRSEQTALSAEERARLEAIQLDAEAIRRAFIWAAEEYGFAETRPVVVSDTATTFDVRDSSSEGPVVLVPADQTADGIYIGSLVVHEAGSHWRNSENMKHLVPWVGSGALKSVNELVYEGDATWRDHKVKLASKGFVKEDRGLYYQVAIWYTYHEKASFTETAQMLYNLLHCDNESPEATLKDVWQVTYRVFRGNPRIDLKTGYVNPKDRAYLAGRLLATELNEAGVGHIMEYSTLSESDLDLLTEKFDLRPQGGMPYPAQDDMAMRLYKKLLSGEFSV